MDIKQVALDYKAAYDDYEDMEGYVVVDEDDWTQDNKYQMRNSVVQHTESGKYFMIHESRSGSYHTDWYFNDPDFSEVEREEKVVVQVTWKPIK